MQEVMQLGPFIIKLKWILLLLSGLGGYILLRYYLRARHLSNEKLLTTLENSLLLGFLVWKFSYILFNPLEVLQNPLNLIYFTGGTYGIWLSIIFVIIYLGIRSRKDEISFYTYNKSLLIGFLGAFVIYQLLFWGFNSIFLDKRIASDPPPNQENSLKVGLSKGNLAPDFKLETQDGKVVTLSDYKGKKVILNFWTTWCPPCKIEMPHMEDFYKDYQSQDVEILAVNLIEAEKNSEDVPIFIENYGITFPVILDEENKVSRLYQVISTPTTYVIDSNGIIQQTFTGPMNYEIMENMIAKIK